MQAYTVAEREKLVLNGRRHLDREIYFMSFVIYVICRDDKRYTTRTDFALILD